MTAAAHDLASYACRAQSVVYATNGAPAVEPVDLDTVKEHLQIAAGNTADDELVATLRRTARHWVEQATGLRLITQTLIARYDGVPAGSAPLLLPVAPLVSITSVVTYDAANVASTFAAASYLADPHSSPPRIAVNSTSAWPSSLRTINALEVTFVAGYGATPALVPEPIREAILRLMAFLYDQRSAVGVDPGLTIAKMPFGPKELLASYQPWWL